ncbi:nicotinate-nucleotide adenylyltransferase [Pseudodesulfovibrio sp.]|uniref:nicotinate-nucleotide adenylyltransferase n=1 Tax=unclassified Pseudodesulfovibrio TaxID=2661612 RepID=UPI003B00000B
MHPLGFIHGRFQVLHNDHLRYLLAGKELCEHLIIGITNPAPDTILREDTDPERSDAGNNPLTYAERETMIRAALSEAGVERDRFQTIPFPICQPEKMRELAPPEAVYYLTIYDDWGREKKKRFESLGLTTHVMWERPQERKGLTGKAVRAAIREGREYRAMVPPAVAELIEKWNLQKRFADSSSGS